MNTDIGTVVGLAIRTSRNGPMRQLHSARADAHGGLQGDVPSSVSRGLTLLSAVQWADVLRELGVELPWHTRRANVLLDCGPLKHLLGKTISVGTLQVRIRDETAPCGLMDRLHAGLRQALVPDYRGGVYGEIIGGGTVQIGDRVRVEGEQHQD